MPASIDPLREQVRGMLRAGWRADRTSPGLTRDELVAAIQGASASRQARL